MKGFKKLTNHEQQTVKGQGIISGIVAAGFIATIAIKSLVSVVSSVKMLFSSKGSVEIDGYESHWENYKPKAQGSSSRQTTAKVLNNTYSVY